MERDSIGLDKKNIASISDLCRACVSDIRLSDNNSTKTAPVTCDNHQLQRLNFQHQVDLEESDFEFVMDTLARENINEIARQIQELGPSFTSSIDSCQQNLQSIVGDGQLDEQLVARLISVMITTPNRGDSGAAAPGGWDSIASTGTMPSVNSPPLPWNGSVFVAAIHNLAPSLSWSDVVVHLDHPYFSVPSKQALQLLTQIIVEGVENHSFPINHIYRLWNGNKAGQLSWLIQIVQNPDIFYMLDQQHRPVNCGCLKVMPDEGTRSCAQWKCLDLVEVLFRLSEVSSLATTVYNLLKTPGPMATCPDLLFLGIVQISLAMSQLRVHILKQLVGHLLGGHANSIAVLGFAWNYDNNRQTLRQIILNAMATYYVQNVEDQSRLTRILGIAHELKPNGLAELFNLQQFPFVIDLACLASRRDFLKLDKFLEDKLSEHGDLFAQQLCQYMKRRCPGLSSTNNPIPTDTFQLMFTVLQSRANTSSLISSELTQLFQQLRSGSVSAQDSGLAPSSTYRDTPPWPPSATNQSSMAAANQQQQPPTMMGQRTLVMTPVTHSPSSTQNIKGFAGPRGLAMKTGVMPALGTSNQPMEFGENLENAVFSDEVQEEANSYFQQIYSPAGRMSVNDFITKLKLFRDSHNQRGKELLMCVLKNLFDEYRFFQEYPDRELRTTAEVYGGIIRENIVMNIHFATAVRKVVEALQSEPMQPLWHFGIVALNACRSCLFRYPKVCQMILNIESFNRFPGQLREYVNSGVNGSLPLTQSADRETPSWPSGPTAMQSVTPVTPSTAAAVNVTNMKFAPRGLAGGGTSILNVTNVDTLINATEREGTQVKQPAVVVYEKVSFICNNLSQTNLLRKTEEMKEIIAECDNDFIHWLAQYLVMKRVTVEQNFQPLYNNFLISINDELLDDYVKKETFRNVSILLRSDKRQAVSNFGDRQLLKNLGHWLGIITIGRDKPILAKDLDLKYLLLEAFYKGQQELLYIVPFVVKTLSASSKSTIFGPRCAWVYGIVKVLVEIHNEPDLKLNLKFEIEVLCKDLNIDLRSVEVGTYLKESSRLPKLIPIKPEGPSPIPRGGMVATGTGEGTIDDKTAQGASLLPPPTRSGDGTGQQQPERSTSTLPGQQQQQVQPPATFHYNDINIYIADGLSQHLKDPSHLALFQLHPQLKVLCKTAIVHAIKDLIGGITERSINVAITATEHVVRKDFAMDPEEQHIRRAAHQMMRSMTAGMAAITCRDPLASTTLAFLKQALHNHLGNNAASNPEQAKMIEEAAFAVTEANLEVATNFIVKSACEKAVLELEKRLENEFSQRNRARKEGRPFQPDPEVVAMTEKVPEQIRVKPGPVADDCLKIYDDFSSKICGFKPLSAQEIFAEFAHRGPMTPSSGGVGPKPPTATINYSSFGGSSMGASTPSEGGLRPGSALPMPSLDRQQQHSISAVSAPPMDDGGVRGLTAGGPDVDDQAALQNKVETILREWMTICYTPMAQRDPPHALSTIVKLMHQTGVLATDDMISKFFKLCADICFDVSYRLLKNEGTSQSTVVRRRCYYTLDAFVKLTCLMVKYSDGVHHSTKVNLLKKVLGILSTALHADHEARKADFNGMPFHRILILMFNELTSPDPVLDPISSHILEAFGSTLFVLQPRRLPGFAFHWLDIIGHRNFIGRLLSENGDQVVSDQTRTAAMYTQLLLCHLKFLAPFLRNVVMPHPIAVIYKGTLRVLLVILHDFPEILCEYHYVLCDVIPANCVQLRNLVLSAYPRDMQLPDPFTKSMEMIESLPEMSANPKMHREVAAMIPAELRAKLDDYLETRSSVSFLSELPTCLQVSQVVGSKYNVSVMNAVVVYVGIRAIDSIHEKAQRISMASIAHTAYMDIFQNLAVSLCTEGRYLLFNAIANQLRYPNSHTHYFSCTLLYLFLEANAEIIQEQITRILFERLVALRPHPWGLLITFIELIRNRRYDFWTHEFVRCAPEIERLFTSVANSCSVGSAVPDHQQPPVVTNGIVASD